MKKWSIPILLAVASVAQAQYPPQAVPKDFPPQVLPRGEFPPQVSPKGPDLAKIDKHDDTKRLTGSDAATVLGDDAKYLEAAKKAVATGKRLVVFVNTPERTVKDHVTIRLDSFQNSKRPRIIMYAPDGKDWLVHVANYSASDETLVEEGVSQPARPFGKSSRPGEVRPTADDDDSGRGPWPVSLPFPAEAERYRPAKLTQSIFQYVGAGPQIQRVNRRELKMEWQVPGGMEGIQGWRSDLYRYVPAGWMRSWQAKLPVVNSSGDTQYELGWTRAYPDGTYFIDALSNADGQPFEVRMREKIDGKWYSYIAFKDASARPTGYHGLTRSCASCHSQAGSGGYGVGLVPGGDTVLSDPLEGLE